MGQETPASIEAPRSAAPVRYTGPTSLEERIFASPVIARVQLDSVVFNDSRIGSTYLRRLE